MSHSFFSPALFFPAAPSSVGTAAASSRDGASGAGGLGDDAAVVSERVASIVEAQATIEATKDEGVMTSEVSVLYGERHSAKSRLLLQLAYRLAAESCSPSSASASSSSSTVLGDPFQQVILLLPRRRNLAHMQQSGASAAQQKHALLGLFGSSMKAEVLNKIQIKWYGDDAELLTALCALSLLTGGHPSNASGVPPRFVGLLYDHTSLNGEALHVAMVLARLSEAIGAFNTMLKATDNGSASQFAPCQSLFCMSHSGTVKRLRTLLPRYATCVYEVTQVPHTSDWLLHTRPCISPSTLQLRALHKLLEPMVELQTAQPLKEVLPSPTTLSLTPMHGMPVLRYTITTESLECTNMYIY